jgi:hypothetical protein
MHDQGIIHEAVMAAEAKRSRASNTAMATALIAGSLPHRRVRELAAVIARMRTLRDERRARRTSGAPPERGSKGRERIVTALKAAFLACDYRAPSGKWAGGGVAIDAGLSPWTAASAETFRVWSDNGKWSGNDLRVHLRVSSSWYRLVRARGLAKLDGMLTLGLGDKPALVTADCTVYAAQWAEQSGRLGLRVRSGYIAIGRCSDGSRISYHAWTATGASGGLAKKRRSAEAEIAACRAEASARARLEAIIADERHTASYDDARSAGYCDTGIRSWCAGRGIDPCERVSLARLYADTSRDARALALRVARSLHSHSSTSD